MRIRLNDTESGSNSTPCGDGNWGEVEDYSVNVISASSDSACGQEEFTNGITAPSGWSFTNIEETYTSAGNYGNSSPSLKFNATDDAVVTAIVNNPSQLSFWIKGVNTDDLSELLVEGYDDPSWETVDNIIPLPTSGTTKTYNSVSAYTKFRFTYTKSVGNMAFDDVDITCDGIVDINAHNENTAISVYPNPNNGKFNIMITNISGSINMSVLDIQGQLIYSEEFDNYQINSSGTYNKEIDLSGNSKGIYFVKFSNNHIIKVEKLFIN